MSGYDLFEVASLLRIEDSTIRLSAFHQNDVSTTTLLVCKNGYLLVRFHLYGHSPVVKQIPWYENPKKDIICATIDPSGEWGLLACADKSLNILPLRSFFKFTPTTTFLWKTRDVTEITPQHQKGIPTALVWWSPSENKHICIVGTNAGEIVFVDLCLQRDVRSVRINKDITNLNMVEDSCGRVTYLIIHTKSGQPWKQLLTSVGHVDGSSSSTTLHNLGFEYVVRDSLPSHNILHDEEGSEQFKPKEFQQFTSSTLLDCQNARGGKKLVTSYNKQSRIYKVFDSNIDNWLPLFVYRLPESYGHIVHTSRLMFAVSHINDKTVLNMLSTQLLEGSSHSYFDQDAILQTFSFHGNQSVVGIYSCNSNTSSQNSESEIKPDTKEKKKVQLPESCIVVTNKGVYHCRPRVIPEELFLQLVLDNLGTLESADKLGFILGLDVNLLYEKAADKRLADGNYQQAMKLYNMSKCPNMQRVTRFAQYGCIHEVLEHCFAALSKPKQLQWVERRQLADLLIKCSVHELLQGKFENTLNKLRHFLSSNSDYDEVATLRLLSDTGMHTLLVEVAKMRGLLPYAVELLVERGHSNGGALNYDQLANQGLFHTLTSIKEGVLLRLLTTQELLSTILGKPDLATSYLSLVMPCLDQLDQVRLLQLACMLDPSKASIHMLLSTANDFFKRQRSASTSSMSSQGSLTSESNTQDDVLVLSRKSLIHNFLRVLLVLNYKRREGSRLYSSAEVLLEEEAAASQYVASTQPTANWQPVSKLLASGQAHSAAVVGEQLYAWGLDEHGRLGMGNTQQNTLTNPQCIQSLPYRVVAVSCGKHHTMALTDHGVFSWGSSQFGQIGHGNRVTCTRPTLVAALQHELCVSITCGQYHSLALSSDERVYSWGWGVHGQLGSGHIEDRLTPQPIYDLDDHGVTVIAAGYCHSSVLDRDGRVWVFGNGSFGQLGRAITKVIRPIELTALSRERVRLLASGRFHMVAVTRTGKVCTWGSDPQSLRQVMQFSRRNHRSKGKAGPCVMDTSYTFPRLVECPKSVHFQQLECGQNHCLMVTSAGQLYVWGRNDSGQLGLGHKYDQRSPQQVVSLFDKYIVAVSAGQGFSVAIDKHGLIFAWGSNDIQQLGVNRQDGSSPKGITEAFVNIRISKTAHSGAWDVLLPITVPGIPVIPTAVNDWMTERSCDKEENDDTEDTTFISNVDIAPEIPPLSGNVKTGPLYGPPSLCLTLEKLSDSYDHKQILQECIDWEFWQGAAMINEADLRHPQALYYQLLVIQREGVTQQGVHKACNKYIRLIAEKAENEGGLTSQTCLVTYRHLLYEIFLFWHKQKLPHNALEELLLSNIKYLALPLTLIIFRFGHQEEKTANEDVVSSVCASFSTDFCLQVTKTVIADISKTKGPTEYTRQLLPHTPDPPMMSVPEEKLWQEILYNLGKEAGVRELICIPENKAATIRETSGETGLDARSVVFTCGHHFPLEQDYRERVVPELSMKLQSLPVPLPASARILSQYYQQDGYHPMACPDCVFTAIKQLQASL
ncbi:uncharacterized protein [Antedon mediterranea]|uniref:uncharacterized protein n=1 Tax=Antedon mediterranea TaxID=105859 RepID=UPI003AF94BDC